VAGVVESRSYTGYYLELLIVRPLLDQLEGSADVSVIKEGRLLGIEL
jgi:hypothetical protein